MAITHKFPVFVMEDHSGLFTACFLEHREETSAVGKNADEALRQLKEYMQWGYREKSWVWREGSDFLEPSVRDIKVLIRPSYEDRDRVYPCQETVMLRLPCVHGREGSGMFVAFMPTIDIRFNYYDRGALKNLAAHYAKKRLQGLPPLQLSGYLPPKSRSIQEISVTFKGKPKRKQRSGWRSEREFEQLNLVAEPMSGRERRRKYTRAWGRDREVADLLHRTKTGRASVILNGEAGIGKTTILFDAARKLERSARERNTGYTHRMWITGAQRIIAGMPYLGQWQERCEEMIEELKDIDGILCMENLLELVKTGGRESLDSVAAFLMPYIKNGELQLIAEATPPEIDACRRLLPGLVDLFQIMTISPFEEGEAHSVLDQIIRSIAQNRRIDYEGAIPGLVYNLFRRFMPYAAFPGKAAAFVYGLADHLFREKVDLLTGQHVLAHFIRQTGLPELFLKDEITLRQDDVLTYFKKEILGQDAACEAAKNLALTFKAGMNDPLRPLGVLLFCGPTGVGKTALAKAISNYFFGHGEESERLIRLDMSEYSGPGSAERILADPDGQPSTLVKKIRQQPFAVVLLDEIEKATPEVFDVFLNVFDEGRLVDRFGRVATFRSAILIMTSNLGARQQASIGFDDQPPSYESEVLSFFRPEFYNRIDQVVTFNPLSKISILAITEKELGEIPHREGLSAADIRITWTTSLVEYLAEQGFDRHYGARQLQRTIERLLVTPLSRYLVQHPNLRDVTINADVNKDNEVVFAEAT